MTMPSQPDRRVPYIYDRPEEGCRTYRGYKPDHTGEVVVGDRTLKGIDFDEGKPFGFADLAYCSTYDRNGVLLEKDHKSRIRACRYFDRLASRHGLNFVIQGYSFGHLQDHPQAKSPQGVHQNYIHLGWSEPASPESKVLNTYSYIIFNNRRARFSTSRTDTQHRESAWVRIHESTPEHSHLKVSLRNSTLTPELVSRWLGLFASHVNEKWTTDFVDEDIEHQSRPHELVFPPQPTLESRDEGWKLCAGRNEDETTLELSDKKVVYINYAPGKVSQFYSFHSASQTQGKEEDRFWVTQPEEAVSYCRLLDRIATENHLNWILHSSYAKDEALPVDVHGKYRAVELDGDWVYHRANGNRSRLLNILLQRRYWIMLDHTSPEKSHLLVSLLRDGAVIDAEERSEVLKILLAMAKMSGEEWTIEFVEVDASRPTSSASLRRSQSE